VPRRRLVAGARLVDLLLGLVRHQLLLRDVVGDGLGGGDGGDGGLVLQDVALAGGQHADDGVLDLGQLPRVLGALRGARAGSQGKGEG
jgi:hypothetical protein